MRGDSDIWTEAVVSIQVRGKRRKRCGIGCWGLASGTPECEAYGGAILKPDKRNPGEYCRCKECLENEARVPVWISVGDSMPDDYEEVLVCTVGGCRHVARRVKSEMMSGWLLSPGSYLNATVTHWMRMLYSPFDGVSPRPVDEDEDEDG